MATTVVEVPPSTEKTTFSDSSEQDITYAKTFWQSVQLLPPMESQLVSSDIKQRLKTAPTGGQSVHFTYPKQEESRKLTDFLMRAQQLEHADRVARMENLTRKREEDLILLHKHRAERVDKERISTGHGVTRPEAEPKSLRDTDFDEYFDEEPDAVLDAIEEFEQRKNLQCDSDSD